MRGFSDLILAAATLGVLASVTFSQIARAEDPLEGQRKECFDDSFKCAFLLEHGYESFSTEAGRKILEIQRSACNAKAWEEASTLALTFQMLAIVGISGIDGIKSRGNTTEAAKLDTLLEFVPKFNERSGWLRLEIADKAFQAGCYERAEHEYRKVIKEHTGSQEAALRDRAKVGIDDVRSKSGSFLCRTIGFC